jgi:hypothetical protein
MSEQSRFKTFGDTNQPNGKAAINWAKFAPTSFVVLTGQRQVTRAQVQQNPCNPLYSQIIESFVENKDAVLAPTKEFVLKKANGLEGVGITRVEGGKIYLAPKNPVAKADTVQTKKQ